MPRVNLFKSEKKHTVIVCARIPFSLMEEFKQAVKQKGTTTSRVVGALIEGFVDPSNDQLGIRISKNKS